jgi:hypothetical protein
MTTTPSRNLPMACRKSPFLSMVVLLILLNPYVVNREVLMVKKTVLSLPLE